LNAAELKLKNKEKEIDNYLKTLAMQRNELENEKVNCNKLKNACEEHIN